MKNILPVSLLFIINIIFSINSFGQKDTLPLQIRQVRELPKIPLSEKIERSVDDFSNEIKISSPGANAVRLLKFIKGKTVSNYLSLTTNGLTVTLHQKDIYILFEDGTKWHKIEKIDCDVTNEGYSYSAWLSLTNLDMAVLKTKKIKKFRLYIHDEEIDPQASEDFLFYVNEISKMK